MPGGAGADACDPLRFPGGGEQAGRAAERFADEVEALEAGGVRHRQNVVRQPVEGPAVARFRQGRAPEAAKVEARDAEPVDQARQPAGPDVAVHRDAVAEQHRVAGRVPGRHEVHGFHVEGVAGSLEHGHGRA